MSLCVCLSLIFISHRKLLHINRFICKNKWQITQMHIDYTDKTITQQLFDKLIYVLITSGVLVVCKCSVFKCNCNEGKANITSRVCECSCSLPDVADVLLPRDALLPSANVPSILSLSTHGNLSTAVQWKKDRQK